MKNLILVPVLRNKGLEMRVMMNDFIYEYKTKNHFGEGCVKKHLEAVLKNYGKNVMLVYGGLYWIAVKSFLNRWALRRMRI